MFGFSPLRTGQNPTLLPCLRLVLQLHQVMVILHIHQAAKGVQHLIKHSQDTQQGSKKVELDHGGDHHCSGTTGCKNKVKEKKSDLMYAINASKRRINLWIAVMHSRSFLERLSTLLHQTSRALKGKRQKLKTEVHSQRPQNRKLMT